jgi:hypothetical protein
LSNNWNSSKIAVTDSKKSKTVLNAIGTLKKELKECGHKSSQMFEQVWLGRGITPTTYSKERWPFKLLRNTGSRLYAADSQENRRNA